MTFFYYPEATLVFFQNEFYVILDNAFLDQFLWYFVLHFVD